jgi:hypothetical protein
LYFNIFTFYIFLFLSMLVHTVFFWLKNPDREADRQALHDGLGLLKTVPEIKIAYIGAPAATRRPVIDSSYDWSITFVFETASDQDVYQVHPIHLQFIATCAHLWERVQVYDAGG